MVKIIKMHHSKIFVCSVGMISMIQNFVRLSNLRCFSLIIHIHEKVKNQMPKMLKVREKMFEVC